MTYSIQMAGLAKQMLKEITDKRNEKIVVVVIGVGIRKDGSKDDIYTRLQKLLIRGYDIN